jgi:hypothetical protein
MDLSRAFSHFTQNAIRVPRLLPGVQFPTEDFNDPWSWATEMRGPGDEQLLERLIAQQSLDVRLDRYGPQAN